MQPAAKLSKTEDKLRIVALDIYATMRNRGMASCNIVFDDGSSIVISDNGELQIQGPRRANGYNGPIVYRGQLGWLKGIDEVDKPKVVYEDDPALNEYAKLRQIDP